MLVGLTQIRGVGYMFAKAILDILKIDHNQNVGNLSDEQVGLIENTIKNPSSSSFPSWFLNRRKDIETGDDKHLLTSEIAFTVRNDIEREKTVGSWRGYRHMYGLKVRGQRTRCTGRKGGAVGVAKGGRILPTRPGESADTAATATATEGEQPVDEKGVEKKDVATEKKVTTEKKETSEKKEQAK